MNSRQLEAFQAVMNAGSMSDAARLMSISQPAVSRLIKDLEHTLGFRLFLRQNGRLYPTPGANRFHQEVERHFVGIDRLQQTVEEIRGMKSGAFRIAVMPALANSLMPEILSSFLRPEPELSVSYASLPSADIAHRVAGQQFDLGIIALPVKAEEVQYGPCFSTDCRIIAPRGHRFGQYERLNISQLDREPFIQVGLSHDPCRRQLEQACKDQLVRPEQRMDTPDSHSAVTLVEQALGVALVDPFSARHYASREGVSCLLEPGIRFSFGIVLPDRRTPNLLVERFIDHFEAQLIRLMPLQPIEPGDVIRG